MKRNHILPCMLLTTLASGCLSQCRDAFDDTRVNCFNHNVAKAAYLEASPLFCSVDCPQSFRLGFMAGFIAMMNGSSGCPPVFPPSSRICSAAWLDDGTPEDRRNAWYDGYSQGVLAAQQTGASDINRIPARLPQPQSIYDPSMPGATPSEFLPLSPTTPTPVPLNGDIPPTPLAPVPLNGDIPAAPPSSVEPY